MATGLENNEPIAWAEELIEPAKAVDHPRRAALYLMASQCWSGRAVEAALRYSEAGQASYNRAAARYRRRGRITRSSLLHSQPVILNGGRVVPHSNRTRSGHHILTWAYLVFGTLVMAGRPEKAMHCRDRPDRGRRDHSLSLCRSPTRFTPMDFAFRDADPHRAMEARRRGLAIARESGNRVKRNALLVGLSGPIRGAVRRH